MTALEVDPGMDLPSLPEPHRLHALLRGRVPKRERDLSAPTSPHAHWAAGYFGLDGVSLFRHAKSHQQQAALERCGRNLLEEAYFIEKAGISFAALMVLLGETIEERMLYATFASEEARHFEDVRTFLHGPLPERADGSFLTLLSDIIASADRTILQFTIQVVLEGWGLTHYRSLRDGCADPSLRQVLDGILLDEAGHHGSGRVLFGSTELEPDGLSRIEDALAPMLRMVQLGPQSVLSALDQTLGGMSRPQRVQVLEELEGPLHAQRRLHQIRQLMRFESLRPLVENLESRRLFTPLSPEECV